MKIDVHKKSIGRTIHIGDRRTVLYCPPGVVRTMHAHWVRVDYLHATFKRVALRHLFNKLDGVTTDPSYHAGPIGKSIENSENYQL